jgi:hypothetical protein
MAEWTAALMEKPKAELLVHLLAAPMAACLADLMAER